MDLATLIKPVLTTGQLRVVGSTTHEEYKHIEKDRALARRLQTHRDRRAEHPGDGADSPGPALPLRGPSPGALPRRRARGGGEAGGAPPARLQAARQRHRRARRSRRQGASDAAWRARRRAAGVGRRRRRTASDGAEPRRRRRRGAAGRGSAPPVRDHRRPHRGSGRAHGAHSGQAGVGVGSRPAPQPRGIARPRRVRAGRGRSHRRARHQALARRPRPAGSPGRLLPLHRSDRRRQDRAGEAAGACISGTSSSATT